METTKLQYGELEQIALEARKSMGVTDIEDSIDPVKIELEGVKVITVNDIRGVSKKAKNYLLSCANKEWSAMSVPLDIDHKEWIIIRNQNHEVERQRASLLEEFWHIILDHSLVRIVKTGDKYGRTYNSTEEEQAYYLASATLIPQEAVENFIEKNRDINNFATKYGVSVELAEYRIKRLGLWFKYKAQRRKISLKTNDKTRDSL